MYKDFLPIIRTEGDTIFNFQFSIFNQNSKLKTPRKGFTLVEIVLVLVVVGIMISGILPLFLNLITVNKTAEYYSIAYSLADTKIEELRSTPFDDLTSFTTVSPNLPSGAIIASVTNQIEGAPQTDIKKVDLTIRWNFRRQQEIKIVTYVSRIGLRR